MGRHSRLRRVACLMQEGEGDAMELLEGFPHWELDFDEDGQTVDPDQLDKFLTDVGVQQLTDVFVFSHGWNNSRAAARDLYQRFFKEMRTILEGAHGGLRRQATIGTAGVIWPSMRWADEEAAAESTIDTGGAASVLDRAAAAPPPTDATTVRELGNVFKSQAQQTALDEMAKLLNERPASEAELARFQQLMRQFAMQADATEAPEDYGEYAGLLEDPPKEVFERMAAVAPPTVEEGGAQAFGPGDAFDVLWSGAKQALRLLTYAEMKQRAGVVGKEGLGPALGRLAKMHQNVRVHLLGHSFGARLVSFALAGLPPGVKPVKSVFLLQGAFSHYAFADRLPHDANRGGALAGMLQRVEGPFVASFSEFDYAVGRAYPIAAMRQRQDAAVSRGRAETLGGYWVRRGDRRWTPRVSRSRLWETTTASRSALSST